MWQFKKKKNEIQIDLAMKLGGFTLIVTENSKAQMPLNMKTMYGPHRFRSIELLVFDEHLSREILSHHLPMELGFNLDENTVWVRGNYDFIDFYHINFDDNVSERNSHCHIICSLPADPGSLWSSEFLSDAFWDIGISCTADDNSRHSDDEFENDSADWSDRSDFDDKQNEAIYTYLDETMISAIIDGLPQD